MQLFKRRASSRSRTGLQTLKRAWALRPEDCPCDIHFVEWMTQRHTSGEVIFHFGTGGHHYVGKMLAGLCLGHSVMGITATSQEFDSYIDLVTGTPRLAHSYCVTFGDIYTLNASLLPVFDVVTVFHLCEFRTEAQDTYGALTDLELLRLLSGQVRPGGHILFYTKSYAYENAESVISQWLQSEDVVELGGFKSLQVFQKRGG